MLTARAFDVSRPSLLPDRFAKTDPVFDGVPEAFIERDDSIILASDLKIDLGAAVRKKRRFSDLHDPSAEARAAVFRMDGEMIDPAAMAVVAAENCPDDATIRDSHEKEFSLDRQLLPDHSSGSVAGWVIREDEMPERRYVSFVRLVIAADLKFRHRVSESERASRSPSGLLLLYGESRLHLPERAPTKA